MLIRAESPADHDAVRAVHRAAFGDDGDHVAAVADALRAGGPASLVAEVGGTVVGHVVVGRNLLDAPPRLVDVGVLSPLAVLPGFQRRGVGTALVAAAREVARERGWPALFVEGDPAYCSRRGFRPGGGLGFRRPSLRIPPAAFGVVLLDGYEEWMTGTLVHDRVFWDLDAVGLR
ncbi:GNAT family N-acetyltransferase [Kineococcus sp. SYSU DK001]|uniref:GNAT family N-acetyltransferase n=1 Tax=Kineococcus sp. SYSU DK001 TaxID=3383122 RepID=UPI003D7C489F